MKIIYQDHDWLVVDKPAGISTHGAEPGDLGVQEWLALHQNQRVYICSRLDKDTSGILLLARSPQASAEAEGIHASGDAHKIYHFVAKRCDGMHREVDIPLEGKAARTSFDEIKPVGQRWSLYQAKIQTGKKHQIRRHAAHIGIPILGDTLYGGEDYVRVMLHCTETHWPGIKVPLTCPIPFLFTNFEAKETASLICALEKRFTFFDNVTNAFRLVHRGEWLNHDLAVERFADFIQINVYQDYALLKESVHEMGEKIIKVLPTHWNATHFQVRSINPNPSQTRLSQCLYETADSPKTRIAEERGLMFHVDFTREHPGLFLDHRDNRAYLSDWCQEKQIANLFCYSGASSLIAHQSHAASVASVDSSKSAIAAALKNLELNYGANKSQNMRFYQEDVRVWIEKNAKKKKNNPSLGWDVIICDPPTFSCFNGKRFSVSKESTALITQCAQLLNPGGKMIFSTNYKETNTSDLESHLKLHFNQVIPLRPPFDFPTLQKGKHHLFSYICKKI